MKDKVKQFVAIMIERGHNIEALRENYLNVLRTENDYDDILKYISENPDATKEDVNYEIQRIHLKHHGIEI